MIELSDLPVHVVAHGIVPSLSEVAPPTKALYDKWFNLCDKSQRHYTVGGWWLCAIHYFESSRIDLYFVSFFSFKIGLFVNS